RSTIQCLASAFTDALRSIIRQGQSRQAGSSPPSDFPLAALDQALVDRLVQQFGSRQDIEDIYALSPMQQGLLFHTLYAPGSGVYVAQLQWIAKGLLQVDGWKCVWQQVFQGHALLG